MQAALNRTTSRRSRAKALVGAAAATIALASGAHAAAPAPASAQMSIATCAKMKIYSDSLWQMGFRGAAGSVQRVVLANCDKVWLPGPEI
jgi:hypothetical protein